MLVTPDLLQSILMEFIATSAGGALFAPPGIAFKKQCLADHG
jgi:hypothetical protein